MKIELEISLEKNTLEVLGKLANVLVIAGGSPTNAPVESAKEDAETPKKTTVKETVTKVTKNAVAVSEADKTAKPDADETEKAYSLDDVRTALADAKHRLGSVESCRKILAEFGAKKASDLDPKNYAAVIAKAKEL